jgi:hypothetical protein
VDRAHCGVSCLDCFTGRSCRKMRRSA